MKEQGTVIKIDGKKVVVKVDPSEECGKCCACGAENPKNVIVTGAETQGLMLGDKVDIDIETSVMVKVYMLIYAIPLVVFVLSVVAAHYLVKSPIISFLSGILFTAIAFFCVSRYMRGKGYYTPRLSKKQTT